MDDVLEIPAQQSAVIDEPVLAESSAKRARVEAPLVSFEFLQPIHSIAVCARVQKLNEERKFQPIQGLKAAWYWKLLVAYKPDKTGKLIHLCVICSQEVSLFQCLFINRFPPADCKHKLRRFTQSSSRVKSAQGYLQGFRSTAQKQI